MQEAKANIKKIVREYKRTFPDEYKIVCDGVKIKRGLTINQYAEVEGSSTEMRALYEISETLYALLVRNLPTAQLLWLKMGDGKSNAGGRWFARTFPEFALPEHI